MDLWHWFISLVSLVRLRICHFPAGLCGDGKPLTLPWTPGRELGTQDSSGVWWAAFSSNPPEKRCVCVCVSKCWVKITFLPHLPWVGELWIFYFLLAIWFCNISFKSTFCTFYTFSDSNTSAVLSILHRIQIIFIIKKKNRKSVHISLVKRHLLNMLWFC